MKLSETMDICSVTVTMLLNSPGGSTLNRARGEILYALNHLSYLYHLISGMFR